MSGWGLMQKKTIVLSDNTSTRYIGRRKIIQTPWFGVYLHRIDRPDTDRYLHDHPWSFRSLILKGGYEEQYSRTGTGVWTRKHRPGSWNHIPHGAYHAIKRHYTGTTVSLVFRGRRRSDWGYLTPDGWVSRKLLHAEWYPDGSDVLGE